VKAIYCVTSLKTALSLVFCFCRPLRAFITCCCLFMGGGGHPVPICEALLGCRVCCVASLVQVIAVWSSADPCSVCIGGPAYAVDQTMAYSNASSQRSSRWGSAVKYEMSCTHSEGRCDTFDRFRLYGHFASQSHLT
jgi:hypothetical protein